MMFCCGEVLGVKGKGREDLWTQSETWAPSAALLS